MSPVADMTIFSPVLLDHALEGEQSWPAGTLATVVDTYDERGAAIEIVDDEGYTLDLIDVPWGVIVPAPPGSTAPRHQPV